MTLRELRKVLPGWTYIKVYKHGIKFSGYVDSLLEADCYNDMSKENVDHIEALAYQNIEIILK